MNEHSVTSQPISPIPSDNLKRNLRVAQTRDRPKFAPHRTRGRYVHDHSSGDDTNGRYCLIDMHIPPGGGPPPHRHDFEESFTLLEGEIDFTFRGEKSVVRAGETVSIPANAPHSFTNATERPARLLCICAPCRAGRVLPQVGMKVAARTTPPPKPDKAEQAKLMKKAQELAPKYRSEILKP